MKKIPNNGEYVAPEINVIEIKSQGVLCGSGNETPDQVTDPDWFGF